MLKIKNTWVILLAHFILHHFAPMTYAVAKCHSQLCLSILTQMYLICLLKILSKKPRQLWMFQIKPKVAFVSMREEMF